MSTQRVIARKCVICGKDFHGHPNALFCSKKCHDTRARVYNRGRAAADKTQYRQEHAVATVCVFCGGPIPSDFPMRAKLCSADCRRRRHLELQRGHTKARPYSRPAKPRPAIERPCLVCGKMFARHLNAKTCSKECAKIRKLRVAEKLRPRVNGPLTEEIRNGKQLSPEEIKGIRHALGETQLQFAARLGVAAVTLRKWEAAIGIPSRNVPRAQMMARLAALADTHFCSPTRSDPVEEVYTREQIEVMVDGIEAGKGYRES